MNLVSVTYHVVEVVKLPTSQGNKVKMSMTKCYLVTMHKYTLTTVKIELHVVNERGLVLHVLLYSALRQNGIVMLLSFMMVAFLHSMTFDPNNTMTNTTLPSYRAPVMHPIVTILTIILVIVCVLVYGSTTLLNYYAKYHRGENQDKK